MDSATKNAQMRKIARFNLLLPLLFFLPPLPFSFAFPLPFFSFHSLRFCHPSLGENYRRTYTPDNLLSCIIRLIPKFLISFALAPLSIYFFCFPIIFLLLLPFLLYYSFLFLPFPFPFPFSFHSPSLSPSLSPSFPFPSFSLFFDFLPWP